MRVPGREKTQSLVKAHSSKCPSTWPSFFPLPSPPDAWGKEERNGVWNPEGSTPIERNCKDLPRSFPDTQAHGERSDNKLCPPLRWKSRQEPPAWLRSQEKKALEKGKTVIIFFVMKQKLNCFYLKLNATLRKGSDPQAAPELQPPFASSIACWVRGGSLQNTDFLNVFLLVGVFFLRTCTQESHRPFSPLFFFCCSQKPEGSTHAPNTTFPGLGPSLQGAGSGHAPVTQQVCRSSL